MIAVMRYKKSYFTPGCPGDHAMKINDRVIVGEHSARISDDPVQDFPTRVVIGIFSVARKRDREKLTGCFYVYAGRKSVETHYSSTMMVYSLL